MDRQRELRLRGANALKQVRDWQGLIGWCQEWIESDSKDAMAWLNLGHSYYTLKHYRDAIYAYSEAIHIDAEHVGLAAWDYMDKAYILLNCDDEEVEALREAILKHYREAIDGYRDAIRCIDLGLDAFSGWYYLGLAYGKLDRYEDEIEALCEALRIDPDYSDAWHRLGFVYGYLDRHQDAIDAYQQAISINPKDPWAWYYLGFTYGELNRYDDAIEAYREVIRIDPEDDGAWNNLGHAYGKLKRYDQATEAYRQAIRIDPENALVWYNLGVAYHYSGNREAAMDALQELRRLDPVKADELFDILAPR